MRFPLNPNVVAGLPTQPVRLFLSLLDYDNLKLLTALPYRVTYRVLLRIRHEKSSGLPRIPLCRVEAGTLEETHASVVTSSGSMLSSSSLMRESGGNSGSEFLSPTAEEGETTEGVTRLMTTDMLTNNKVIRPGSPNDARNRSMPIMAPSPHFLPLISRKQNKID